MGNRESLVDVYESGDERKLENAWIARATRVSDRQAAAVGDSKSLVNSYDSGGNSNIGNPEIHGATGALDEQAVAAGNTENVAEAMESGDSISEWRQASADIAHS